MIRFVIRPYWGTFDNGLVSLEAKNAVGQALAASLQDDIDALRRTPGYRPGADWYALEVLQQHGAVIVEMPEPVGEEGVIY